MLRSNGVPIDSLFRMKFMHIAVVNGYFVCNYNQFHIMQEILFLYFAQHFQNVITLPEEICINIFSR